MFSHWVSYHTELSDVRTGLYKCTLAKGMFLAKYNSRLFDTPISLSLITGPHGDADSAGQRPTYYLYLDLKPVTSTPPQCT